MIFHENHLLADNYHVLSYFIFLLKIGKDVAKFVVCCSCNWRLKAALSITFDLFILEIMFQFFKNSIKMLKFRYILYFFRNN